MELLQGPRRGNLGAKYPKEAGQLMVVEHWLCGGNNLSSAWTFQMRKYKTKRQKKVSTEKNLHPGYGDGVPRADHLTGSIPGRTNQGEKNSVLKFWTPFS